MLNKKTAKEKIESIINKPDPYWQDKPRLVVLDEQTIDKEWGWVFFYNTSEYSESGKSDDDLLGNAPYIVNKNTGEIIETGTAYNIEHYIREYESEL